MKHKHLYLNYFKMRLFSQTSKLCLLTLLFMLVYGGDGQITGFAGKCGTRPIYDQDLLNQITFGRSPVGIYKSNDAADDLNVERSVDKYSKSRVINGHNARHGDFPWQGRMHLVSGFDPEEGWMYDVHYCGAVIIDEYWLLTAEHCFRRIRYAVFRIHVGDYNILTDDNGEQAFDIENVISHPDYNKFINDNDIALIKIKPNNGRGIQFNSYVQPVCLPDPMTQFKAGTPCHISGWGDTRTPYETPILQKAVLPIVNFQGCKQSHESRKLGLVVTKNMICAGYPFVNKGGCHGDSGGPFVCRVGNVFTLAGLVSWGHEECSVDYPSVFTRITAFIPWIKDVINK